MNKRQKRVLAGMKPERREGKRDEPPVRGVSPITVCAKWIHLLEVLNASTFRSFQMGALGVPEDVLRGYTLPADAAEALVVNDEAISIEIQVAPSYLFGTHFEEAAKSKQRYSRSIELCE